MNFASLAGDDEHTAVDGPYARLMKTRKWLVLSSALAVLSVLRLYDAQAFHDLIKIANVPDWLLANALLGGLIYLTLQYGLLIYQLMVTYDLTLSERLTFRRAEELSKAREAWQSASNSLAEAESQVESRSSRRDNASRHLLERDVADAERELMGAIGERDRAAQKGEGTLEWTLAHNAVLEAQTELQQAKADLQTLVDSLRNRDKQELSNRAHLEALREAVSKSTEELQSLNRQDPSGRGWYKQAEVAIDILRLGPALLIALLSIVSLVRAFH